MEKFQDANRNIQDYDAAVNLMDDELREEIHAELAPCTNQEFIEEYARRHKEKYGEDFAPWIGGSW